MSDDCAVAVSDVRNVVGEVIKHLNEYKVTKNQY